MCDHYNIKLDSNHSNEHKKWGRRSFLKTLGFATSGAIMLKGMPLMASKPSLLEAAISNLENDRILVLIRLKGGNDGLNTIVPIYDFDTYSNLRPTIKHSLSDLYNLSDDFGIPNYMEGLLNLWGDGGMKVIQGVGYDNQSLSHFRSSDIWASAENESFIESGWLGRYFENIYPDYIIDPPESPAAIQIGSVGNSIFDDDSISYGFSVANPDQLESIAQNGSLYSITDIPECVYGEQLEYLRGVTNTTFNYAGTIHNAYTNSVNNVEYSSEGLGKQLAIVARLIKGGLSTKVYMVTLDGFDTHANQLEKHPQLLFNLAESVRLFYEDIAFSGQNNEVLSMTISEFGRRPSENGSIGTDHGSAAPLLMFGHGLNGNGFIGAHPNLSNLDENGNLSHLIDFRQVYASIMKEWLCIDPQLVDLALMNNYDSLELGFSCNLSNNVDNLFIHYGLYQNNKTYISFINPCRQNVSIKLYDITGKEVAILKNETLNTGEYKIDVKNESRSRLSTGQYIYRISANNKFYSKSIIVY